MSGLSLSSVGTGESLTSSVQGLGETLVGSSGGGPGDAGGGLLGPGGASLKDALGQVTGGGKGLFDQARTNAGNLMNANSVDGSLSAARNAIIDPNLTQGEMVQNAFGGVRRMSMSGLQTLVGDLVQGTPGSGTKIDSLFEGATQQFLGKMAPGMTALQTAEKAKEVGSI